LKENEISGERTGHDYKSGAPGSKQQARAPTLIGALFFDGEPRLLLTDLSGQLPRHQIL
jgi:hypothetical protein